MIVCCVIIAALISDGLEIEGLGTSVVATLIVWVAALAAAIILAMIFVKSRIEDHTAWISSRASDSGLERLT